MVLWQAEDCDRPPQDSDYYPATVVAHKEHVRLGYIIHFDDGSIRERVDLPDETIRIDFDQPCVDCCRCAFCALGAGGRTCLPVEWESDPS